MKLRYRIEYIGYLVLSFLVAHAPLWLVKAVASLVAGISFRLGGGRVEATLENLRVAFPELPLDERRALARASFEHFLRNAIDFARSERWSAEEMARHIEVVGLENLEAALSAGKGAFILTLHLGNFELTAAGLGLAGVDMLVIGRPLQNPLLWERIVKSRTRFGGELIDRARAAPAMIRALRANRVVPVLNDQYTRRSQGIFVPFFGVRASTSAGVATLAVRTGARVCPSYTVRDGEDHHTFYILPALDVALSGDRKADIEAHTAAHNAAFEAMIRKHPEQWMWGHRRFRHSPDLVDDPYTERVASPRRPSEETASRRASRRRARRPSSGTER